MTETMNETPSRGWWRWPGASGSAHEDVNARDYFRADGITPGDLELMRQAGAAFLASQGIGMRDSCNWPSGHAHRIDPGIAAFSGAAATPAMEQAAKFTGVLWQAVSFSGGIRIREHRHYQGAFDPAWLASLDLPDGDDPPPGQPVTLIGGENMDRYPGAPDSRGAQTLVLEDIGACDEQQPWYKLAGSHLTILSGSDQRVTASLFESRFGDESFVAHRDAWLGGVVQMAGAKRWLIGEGLLDGTGVPAKSVVTSAGDILLIPKHAAHSASTPDDPGYSVHLAFALCRDAPSA